MIPHIFNRSAARRAWANVAPATTTHVRAPIVGGRAYVAILTRRTRRSDRRTRRSFQNCKQRTDGGGRCSELMRWVDRWWWSSTGRVGPGMARRAGVARLKNMPWKRHMGDVWNHEARVVRRSG